MNKEDFLFNWTPERFRNEIKIVIKELQDEQLQEKHEPEYITRTEAADLLNISLPTLHSLTQKGRLVAYRLGKRVLYRKDEIFESMKSIR